jgi:hypothetical protein
MNKQPSEAAKSAAFTLMTSWALWDADRLKGEDFLAKVAEWLDGYGAKARREAQEEACRLTCPDCYDGFPVEGDRASLYHPKGAISQDGLHRMHRSRICDAASIRAVMSRDEPPQEPA